MNGFDLFAALTDVDEKLLRQGRMKADKAVSSGAEAAEQTEGETGEYVASPSMGRSSKVLGVVAAACLCVGIVAGVLLHWVFTRPNEWGTAQQGGCVLEPPEDTSGAEPDLEPHILLTLNGMEEYYALQEKLTLSDEDLTRFLTEKGYAVMGLTDREQLKRLLAIPASMPIPSYAGEAPGQIRVDDRSAQVVFTFDGILVEVQRQPSAATVERKTHGLSRVPEYDRYPLYFGSSSEAGGIVAARYVLNVNDHAVELEVKAGSAEETLSMLDALWFFELNAAPKHGVYFRMGENPDNEEVPMVHINTQTGVFVASAGISFSYAEHGQYVLEKDRLIVTTQSATFVFAVLDSEKLLLLDDGGFKGWLKVGEVYKWSNDI